MDDEHPVAVEDADPNGLVRPGRKRLGPGQGAPAQVAEIEVAVRQLQELRPELVLVAVRVLLHEAMVLERSQQPVHRPLGEPEPCRQLAYAQPPGPSGEGLEDPDGAID